MAGQNERYIPRNDFENGTGFFNRLNRRLFPHIGPPPLGPYDQPAPRDPAEASCPLCGKAMRLHEYDRSGGPTNPTKLYCPS